MATLKQATTENIEQDILIFAHQPALQEVYRLTAITAVSTQTGESSTLTQEKENGHRSIDSNISDTSTKKEEPAVSDFEDYKYRWLIVFAAFLSQTVGIGIIMSWGVLQDYFEQNVFRNDNSTVIQLSLVGSLGNFALNVFSPFVQVLVSIVGIKSSVLVATVLSTAGLGLASFSNEIWQLTLSQGILFGAGGSIVFYIGMSSVQQWFSHKRGGIALGIASSGSCIGGLVMPLIITPLNRSLGVKICFRILAGITCVFYIIPGFLFKDKDEYLKAKNANQDNEKLDHIKTPTVEKSTIKAAMKSTFSVIEFDVLKDANFLLWCIADIVIELSYYTPVFFLPSYATHLGLKDTQGAALVSICAACNAIGRILSGVVSDYIGHINTIIITCFFAGSSAFFIWTFAYDFVSLVFFAGIFGFFGGTFIALGPATTATVTGMDKFKSGYSMFLLITIPAMFGPNLAGALEGHFTTRYNEEPFLSYKMFTGCGYILGVIVLLILKWRINRGSLLSKL